MIDLVNNGKVVIVEYNKEQEVNVIKLAKKLTLKPKEQFTINTKLRVTCTEDIEECVISGYVKDDTIPLYIVVKPYLEDEEDIILIGYYAGEEELSLPKGTVIAKAGYYHNCLCNQELYKTGDEEQPVENGVPLISNEHIRIIALDDTIDPNLEMITEMDGSQYFKIKLNNTPVERIEINE